MQYNIYSPHPPLRGHRSEAEYAPRWGRLSMRRDHSSAKASTEPKKRRADNDSSLFVYGAGDVTRTHDLLITNQLHYRLCYTSATTLLL